MDTDVEALIHLNDSLKYLQKLKVTLNSLFDSLSSGPVEGQENNAYLRGIQQRLISMDTAFSDLENSGNMLTSPNPPPNSCNSMGIAMEPEEDSYEMFHQLINSYTWSKKVLEYSSCVNTLLKDNQLKRSGHPSGSVSKRVRKSPMESHNLQPAAVDNVVAKLSQTLAAKHPDTVLQLQRPLGISAVLVIGIAKTLKAVIIFRGLLTERIIVKGYGESTVNDNGQVDLWGESKHRVFQLVTQCAQAAILHFHSPIFLEFSLYSLVHWLHTYSNLFTGECNYCHKILNDFMPPTGRGYEKTALRYHPQCASSQAK